MKIKLIATKKNYPQQGFGLLETTAAAMLSILFISTGANLVLTASLYKVKAKITDAMNSLIRADIESIKYQSTKQNNLLKCSPSDVQNGFAGELKEKIGADSPTSNTKTTTIKVLGRNYILTRRTDSIIDSDILPIGYTFAAEAPPSTPQSAMPIEYNLTVQIIPNAAFQCNSRT